MRKFHFKPFKESHHGRSQSDRIGNNFSEAAKDLKVLRKLKRKGCEPQISHKKIEAQYAAEEARPPSRPLSPVQQRSEVAPEFVDPSNQDSQRFGINQLQIHDNL